MKGKEEARYTLTSSFPFSLESVAASSRRHDTTAGATSRYSNFLLTCALLILRGLYGRSSFTLRPPHALHPCIGDTTDPPRTNTVAYEHHKGEADSLSKNLIPRARESAIL